MTSTATSASIKPKLKFNKAKKKRGAIRKSRDADDSDDDDDKNGGALTAIESTKKKQKLAQSTLYKRGLDVNKIFKEERKMKANEDKSAAAKNNSKATAEDAQNAALFKTTFSSTETGPSETIMQQKHQSAMEDFINKRMNVNENDAEGDNDGNMQDVQTDGTQQQEGEADMGAGGTMLGGTGIAEVILPIEQRLQTVKQTEELRASLPMTFGKKTISSAGYHLKQSDVAGVAASFSQNFREPRTAVPAATQNESEPVLSTPAADDGRVGFQAARHGQVKEPRREQRNHRASDDRVLKRFIKKERQKR